MPESPTLASASRMALASDPARSQRYRSCDGRWSASCNAMNELRGDKGERTDEVDPEAQDTVDKCRIPDRRADDGAGNERGDYRVRPEVRPVASRRTGLEQQPQPAGGAPHRCRQRQGAEST